MTCPKCHKSLRRRENTREKGTKRERRRDVQRGKERQRHTETWTHREKHTQREAARRGKTHTQRGVGEGNYGVIDLLTYLWRNSYII